MRLIYVDEAGTSAPEPVRVVASVIVDADTQWRRLNAELTRLILERVPAPLQPGFIIHGKELFNGGKHVPRGCWSFDERLDFLKEVICLPYVHDVPIACGIVHAGVFNDLDLPLATNELEHAVAFAKCIERSDHFIRKYLGGREVGVVVAEDLPERRRLLRDRGMRWRDRPLVMTADMFRPDRMEQELGLRPNEVTQQITNVVDDIHFAEKQQAQLLQLADVCAFAFRRFLAGQPHGEDLMWAMLGHEGGVLVNDPIWHDLTHSGLFNTRAYWSPDHVEAARQRHEQLMQVRFNRAMDKILRDTTDTGPVRR